MGRCVQLCWVDVMDGCGWLCVDPFCFTCFLHTQCPLPSQTPHIYTYIWHIKSPRLLWLQKVLFSLPHSCWPCCLQLQGVSLVLKVSLKWPSKDSAVYEANSCLFAYCPILTLFFPNASASNLCEKGDIGLVCVIQKRISHFLLLFLSSQHDRPLLT